MREQIKSFARNDMQLNWDKGSISAVIDAINFFEADMTQAEAEDIAFELSTEDLDWNHEWIKQ